MEKYLQILVITLPALAIAMGGLLLVVFICLRSWSKVSANLPVSQCSVTTQSDGSLQVNHEIRDELVEEAMERVKMFLSEEFRKKQATKISQEEFNKLYRTKRGLDSGSSTDRTDEKRKRQEMESMCNIPGIARLTNSASTTNNSVSLKKTESFATLWVEELQRSGDVHSVPDTQRESEEPKNEPAVEALPTPPQHSIVTCRDSPGTRLDPASQHCMLTQVELNEATEMIEVKPCNELRLIQDLEMFLLKASSNLCRSIMAFSIDYKPGSGLTVSSNKEICMRFRHDLELGPNELASVASTSMNAPQLLKGGASQDHEQFIWRLDIEDDCAEPSPPNTPVRRHSPSHLCRGVQFQVAEHPPAMSIIRLDPEQGYGWRGPDWKETFGKHHIYKEHEETGVVESPEEFGRAQMWHKALGSLKYKSGMRAAGSTNEDVGRMALKGPTEYRKRKQNLASDHSVAQYYKSVEADAKRKWKTVKERYRRAKELAALKTAIREDIQRSAEWRKHLRESVLSQSSSADTTEREAEERRRRNKDDNIVKSMLTTSSSSPDSDDSVISKFNKKPRCMRKHKHCEFENPKNNRRNY